MPDFGDPRTGEGERKVPPGAVLKRRRKMRKLYRQRRYKRGRWFYPDDRRIT